MTRFRFIVLDKDNKEVAVTEWYDEPSRGAAPQKLMEVKRQYGADLRYRVEREGLENSPNKQEYTRFKVQMKDAVNYSRLLTADQVDHARSEIQQLFPGATLTEERVVQ